MISNTDRNMRFYVNEDDLYYCDRRLSVKNDNDWHFKGAIVIEKSGTEYTEPDQEGDRMVVKKNFFSTEYIWSRKNGDPIPEGRVSYTIYLTAGGSYIAYQTSDMRGSKAKIVETVADVKSFFGDDHLAKQLYQELVESNSHLASGLLSDYMKVIK